MALCRQTMGLSLGLDNPKTVYKRKFRWLLTIKGVIGGVDAMPPMKAARPKLSFKEFEAPHVSETIFFPGRPEWQTITVTALETNCSASGSGNGSNTTCSTLAVETWYRLLYDPSSNSDNDSYLFAINDVQDESQNILRTVTLDLFGPCGTCLERWIYEGAFPQQVDWDELDMGSYDLVMCNITLRYARAYTVYCDSTSTGGSSGYPGAQ